jgi:hypothetical protein
MIRLYRQQFRYIDLKALAHGLMGGACLLLTLMVLGPSFDDKALGALQENSSSFFVQCNTNDCSSLITPFVAYLLNIEKNLGQLFILWLTINTWLSVYLFLKLAQAPIKSKHAFAISTIPFVLIALNTFNPSSLITMLPCALSALLASVSCAQGGRNWAYFITGAVLFSLPMGLLLFGSLVCYLMSTQEGKQDRRDMVKIVHSIALALAMIALYLLLIEYNFLGWINTDGDEESLGTPILRIVSLNLSYLTTLIALISIYAEKIK